jgi:hypothetical protein
MNNSRNLAANSKVQTLVSLVIPVFSQTDGHDWLVERLLSSDALDDVSVLIIDNGCEQPFDHSRLKHRTDISVYRTEFNLGFGGAVSLANSLIPRNHSLAWMPGNGKVDPRHAISWVRGALRSDCLVAKAIRQRKFSLESFKAKIAEFVLSVVTGQRIVDYGGTPTCISRDIRETFFLNSPSGIEVEIFTIAFAKRNRIKMYREHCKYGERPWGSSTWRRGLRSEVRLFIGLAICVWATRLGLQKSK